MQTDSKGAIFVMSGPSGVGKGTIRKNLGELTARINMYVSVSHTTRAPREGEVCGVDYSFVCEEEFQRVKDAGGFLESAGVHGKRYGSPRVPFEAALDAGRPCLFEIDVQGALEIRKLYPDAVMVFILPPSLEELHKRLTERNAEKTAEELEKRFAAAKEELGQIANYDYFVVNDNLDEAVKKVEEIICLSVKQ